MYLQELAIDQLLALAKVRISENPADLITERLPRDTLQHHRTWAVLQGGGARSGREAPRLSLIHI
eukprot:14496192-Alexandrium_andersonii.AAC.1